MVLNGHDVTIKLFIANLIELPQKELLLIVNFPLNKTVFFFLFLFIIIYTCKFLFALNTMTFVFLVFVINHNLTSTVLR